MPGDVGRDRPDSGARCARIAARRGRSPADSATGPALCRLRLDTAALENLLYRVEIHSAGAAGGLYKWSRENAIHRTRFDKIESGALVVHSIGRDEQSALKPEDWIEIRDADAILSESPGYFARIAKTSRRPCVAGRNS